MFTDDGGTDIQLNAFSRVDIPIDQDRQVSGVGNPGLLACGQLVIDPNDYGLGLTYEIVVTLAVDDVLRTASVTLHNLSDNLPAGENVTLSAPLTSSSEDPEVKTATLTVGAATGNLKNTGTKIYEVRLGNDGTSTLENVFLGTAKLVIR